MMMNLLWKAKRTEDSGWVYGLPKYDIDCNVNFIETNIPKTYPNCFKIDTKTLCKYICSDTKGCNVFEYDIVYIPIDEGAGVESLIPYVVYYSALNTGYMVIPLEDVLTTNFIPSSEYLCEFIDCIQYCESLFDFIERDESLNIDTILTYLNTR